MVYKVMNLGSKEVQIATLGEEITFHKSCSGCIGYQKDKGWQVRSFYDTEKYDFEWHVSDFLESKGAKHNVEMFSLWYLMIQEQIENEGDTLDISIVVVPHHIGYRTRRIIQKRLQNKKLCFICPSTAAAYRYAWNKQQEHVQYLMSIDSSGNGLEVSVCQYGNSIVEVLAEYSFHEESEQAMKSRLQKVLEDHSCMNFRNSVCLYLAHTDSVYDARVFSDILKKELIVLDASQIVMEGALLYTNHVLGNVGNTVISPLLLNVTHENIGYICSCEGKEVLISENTTIPTRRSKEIKIPDGCKEYEIKVTAGPSENPEENDCIKTFNRVCERDKSKATLDIIIEVNGTISMKLEEES